MRDREDKHVPLGFAVGVDPLDRRAIEHDQASPPVRDFRR
jgi:hypothetical protein